jgi:hypothetical protein
MFGGRVDLGSMTRRARHDRHATLPSRSAFHDPARDPMTHATKASAVRPHGAVDFRAADASRERSFYRTQLRRTGHCPPA